jgi:hypothetical protein
MSDRTEQDTGPNYDDIYSVFDGNMPGCLGENCPNSCCKEKTAINLHGDPVTYRASLLDQNEYDHQRKLDERDPLLQSIDVALKCITDISGVTAYIVQNCLGTTGCKLAQSGRKPAMCRMAPIGGDVISDMKSCPALNEIKNQGGANLQQKIREIFKKTRFSDILWKLRMEARRRMT